MKIISEYDIEPIKPQTPQSAEDLEITKKFRQMHRTLKDNDLKVRALRGQEN